MADKVSIVDGHVIVFREDGKASIVSGHIVKNQDAPVGGATGKSNPLYGCLGGCLRGQLG